MIPPKLEKMIHKAAKKLDVDEKLVYEIMDKLFRDINNAMNDYDYPRIKVPGFGTLVPKVHRVEDEIERLLLKMKNHKNPTLLNGKIETLNITIQRLRNENERRDRKNAARVVTRTERGLR
jgi:nucleoid DNA-binding protein